MHATARRKNAGVVGYYVEGKHFQSFLQDVFLGDLCSQQCQRFSPHIISPGASVVKVNRVKMGMLDGRFSACKEHT